VWGIEDSKFSPDSMGSYEFSHFVGFMFSQTLIFAKTFKFLGIPWIFIDFHENPIEIYQKSINFLQKS
jgi:hypothetical protein